MHTDQHFMRVALTAARQQLGNTASNPAVGCAIVKDGVLIANAATGKNGVPHAEILALKQAGKQAENATLYVTLEPCAHQGKTPPCSQAIIRAGIRKIVIAMQDPFPAVNGKGIAELQQAGIEVVLGVGQQEAAAINAGFCMVCQHKRPFVSVKLATSLDGKIATKTGESKWITGKISRLFAHKLRAQHDAIMVGMQTVLADDPLLTCRLPGLTDRNPIRLIIGKRPLCQKTRLWQTSKQVPLWHISNKQHAYSANIKTFKMAATRHGFFSIQSVLHLLAEQGVTRLLVEGGSTLIQHFLQDSLIDQLIWIRAPMILGNDAKPALPSLNQTSLANPFRYQRQQLFTLEEDMVEIYSPLTKKQ